MVLFLCHVFCTVSFIDEFAWKGLAMIVLLGYKINPKSINDMIFKKQKKGESPISNIWIKDKDYKSIFYSLDTILGIDSHGEFKYQIKKAFPK